MRSNYFRLFIVAALVIFVVLLTYFTGGVTKSYPHLIYIPIILAALFWQIKGGVSVALAAGLLLGPMMPVDVAAGVPQTFVNWITRLSIFVLVAFVSGFSIQELSKSHERQLDLNLISPTTGAYTSAKLHQSLEEKIRRREHFALASVKLINIEQISKYTEHKAALELVQALVNDLADSFGKKEIYTSGYSEIDLILSSDPAEIEKLKDIVKRHSSELKIKEFTFHLYANIGIYQYHGSDTSPVSVYGKARIAWEQGDNQKSDIFFYDEKLDQERKFLLEISGSLPDAIRNGEFYLVYQPQISIDGNHIVGVETLARWDRKDKKAVGPAVFITLAEDLGLMSEITDIVLAKTGEQIIAWCEQGLALDVSINFTANELLEDHFIEKIRKLSDIQKLYSADLIIEITERIISEQAEQIKSQADKLRAAGVKISIDDFGTGYNSLTRIAHLPFDQIKLDKYFIDNLADPQTEDLVDNIIKYAHKTDRSVVAEGVETEEQVAILTRLGCDIVQGYYYSRPLTAEKFEEFYHEFSSK